MRIHERSKMRGGNSDGAIFDLSAREKFSRHSLSGVHSAESPHSSEPSEGGALTSRSVQMTTTDVEHDPETALHADVVTAAANTEKKYHRANLDDAFRHLPSKVDASSRRAPRNSGPAASGGARGRRKGRWQQLMEWSEDMNPAKVLVALVAIPIGIAACAAYLWACLIGMVPGYLYKYSGPFKWAFDPIRSFLHSIFFDRDDDEDFLSIVGALGGCVSGIGYVVVGMVLLVFYLKFVLNTRFDRVRTYNEAVASWQEGLADEYASNWTSAGQLPTLRLEQTVDARDHASPLTYAPAFHLETNTTFEQSLPQLDTPGDMDKYDAKTMVAATIENFHVPTIRPSEGDGMLSVGIGDQNFTFATVRRYKVEDSRSSTLHCDEFLNGLVFVFDEEVRRHECTPMYEYPGVRTCHDRWSSLHPPQNLSLRVEIRSPNDPVIVARDLFGCSTEWGSALWTESARDHLRRIAIIACILGFFGLLLFLFSTPDMWFADPINFLNKIQLDNDDDDVEKSSRVDEETKPAEPFVDTGATKAVGPR